MDDPAIYEIDLPCRIRAFTVVNADGATTYLNARLAHEQRKASYLHEAQHIKNGDFHAEEPADQIEFLRHRRD